MVLLTLLISLLVTALAAGAVAWQLRRPANPHAPAPAATGAPRESSRQAPAAGRDPLGRLLHERGRVSMADLDAGLATQRRSGGRLGEILVAGGHVDPEALSATLGEQMGVEALDGTERPVPLLPRDLARALDAVALDDGTHRAPGGEVLAVAFSDPTAAAVAEVADRLDRPVRPKLADPETLDALLTRAYGADDAAEATMRLWRLSPQLSALNTRLSPLQLAVAAVLGAATLIGLLIDPILTGAAWVGLATVVFGLVTVVRLGLAWLGWRGRALLGPSQEELATMDERALPVYTVLVPLYREKISTIRELLRSLDRLDYPKHKLDGVLLVEADDDETARAIEAVGRPPWLKLWVVPAGEPKTKPRAMLWGLEYARGEVLTVFDAEDQPEPQQLKKAAWALAAADEGLACLQASLAYHNPRQNLLTRWFTLEYDAWFGLFLPGLHGAGGPIPLGGTSNHFRTAALRECLGWDPFNVTEDADLGLRLSRLGFRVAMLDSVTYEEANSRLPNWLRQRSRWIKGYMQTVLVHTRDPRALVRDVGVRDAALFLLTVGGSVLNALLLPVFLALLVVWTAFQPDWIAAILPGPVYYPSLVLLVLGNFLLVLAGVATAVARDHDDLVTAALLLPIYWLLASAAAYVALVELVTRPHHWHKTEHGLHLAPEPS